MPYTARVSDKAKKEPGNPLRAALFETPSSCVKTGIIKSQIMRSIVEIGVFQWEECLWAKIILLTQRTLRP